MQNKLFMNFQYGVIPKKPMQDTLLSIQSKAIYAYLCSYAGSSMSSYPSRELMQTQLGVSKDTLGKYLKELREAGYITIDKHRNDGKFSNNIYSLNAERLPCPKSSDTVKPDTISSDTINLVSTSNNNTINNNTINKYKNIYDHYIKSELIKHTKYVPAMTKAIKKAEKELGLDAEHMKRMIDRHKEKVEATKNDGQYKTKPRGIKEFFGQKKYGSTDLICADYHDDVWEGIKQSGNASSGKVADF